MKKEIQEFLDYCLIEKNLSKNTIESYKNDLSRFEKYLMLYGKQ